MTTVTAYSLTIDDDRNTNTWVFGTQAEISAQLRTYAQDFYDDDEIPTDDETLMAWLTSDDVSLSFWTDEHVITVSEDDVHDDLDDSEQDDDLVTCSECSAELPSDEPCPVSEDGEHQPDMEISAPPADDPTRLITVQSTIEVPNDGYDYFIDVGGRLERIFGRMLRDRLVTSVRTSGPSGSGWICDGEAPR